MNDDTNLGPHPSQPFGYLMFADGTRYRIEGGLVKWIRDRNGNKVSYAYEVVSGDSRVKTITDTLGRIMTVNYDINDPTYGLCDQIVVPGFGMTSRIISVKKTSLSAALRYDQPQQPQTYGQLFPEAQLANANGLFNPSIVSAVYLPNGQSYNFYYNTYGELARIQVPEGGAVDYDYQGGLTNEPNSGAVIGASYVYRRVVAKRVFMSASNLGSNTRVTTYSRPESWSAANSVDSVGFVAIEDRAAADNTLLSYQKSYFYGAAANSFITRNPYPAWKDGKEYQTDIFAMDRTTVLRRSIKNWQQRASVSWWSSYAATQHLNLNDEPANDPRVVETTQVIEPSGPNLVTKATAINPQTLVLGFDQHNNQTDSWQYDYGVGAPSTYPILRAHTDYLALNPANNISYADPANGNSYTVNDAHLRDVARARQIYSVNPANGVESLIAQSETRYDEPSYPLLTYGTVSSWNDPGSARGNATTTRNWVNTSGLWLEAHAQYDQCGSVRKIWDARDPTLTNPSQVSYWDSFSGGGPGNTYAFPTSVTTAVPDPNGVYGSSVAFTTTSVYDYNTGKVVATTDPNAKTTSYDYTDPLNRLKQVVFPDGGRVRYNYFETPGNLYLQQLTDEDSSRSIETRKYFDGLGRPIRSFLYDGTPSTPWLVNDTYYDNMGRVSKVSNPYRVSTPSAAVPVPCSVCTTTGYDALSRVLTVTTPDSAQVATSYGASTSGTLGTITTVTDQALRKRRSLTDVLGRLVRVDEPNKDTGSLDVGGASTSYTYDVLGNLRKVEQGIQKRFFMYDSLGRLLRAKNPEQAAGSAASNLTDSVTNNAQWSMAYGYDNNGNLTARVDARNITTNYGYDALNRSTTVNYSDATLDSFRKYDFAINGKGRINQVWQSGSTTSATYIDSYDSMGRPLIQRQKFQTSGVWSASYQTQRAYDLAGHVNSQTYPSGRTVTYDYDIAGRSTSFSGSLGDGVTRTYASGMTYSPFGGMQQEQFGTQVPLFHKLHYNVRGQMYDVRLSTVAWATDQWNWNRGAIALYFGYPHQQSGLRNNGNVSMMQHFVPGNDQLTLYNYTEQRYVYDELNRLKSVSEYPGTQSGLGLMSFTQIFDYDRWGNRTINPATTNGMPETQFTASVLNDNRLGVPAGYPGRMDYDAAGNLVNDTHTPTSYGNINGVPTRLYDAENRLTTAKDGNLQVVSSYSYNADGQRTRRTVNGVQTWQGYGMDGELLGEYASGAASFVATKEYGYRNGQLLVTVTNGDDQRVKRFLQALYYGALQIDAPAQWMTDKTNELAAAGAQSQTQLLVKAKEIARALFAQTNYETNAPLRNETQYVTDLYYAYLQRGPDAGGLGWWGPQAAGSVQNRINVLNAFEVSGEFQTLVNTLYGTATSDGQRTDNYVTNFYQGALGRPPTSSELSTNSATLNSAAAQGQTQVISAAETMGRSLFAAQVNDASLSNTQFVTNLYEGFLQRGPDASGLSWWAGQASVGSGRQNVLNAFAASSAFRELAGTLYREASWLVADHLGTPRMIVNKSGSLAGIKRHDYLPFGEELFAGQGARTLALGYTGDTIRQKFTSYERDNETELDYAKARYYASTQGRFTGTDPYLPMADSDKEEFFKRYLKQPQNWNRYLYCINNPLSFIDPSGLGWYVKKGDEIGHPTWFDDDKVDTKQYEAFNNFLYKDVETGRYAALNPFKGESAEFDTSEEADAAYQGYIINQAAGDFPRLPDAVSAGGGMLFLGQTYTFDAYGQSFTSHLDVYPRRPMAGLRFRSGFSLNFIWLDQATTPTPAESRNAFTGGSLSVQGGNWLGGQYSFGQGTNTIGFGFTTPGAGAVLSPNAVQSPNHWWRWR